jgi:hypothetical protein
VRAEKVRGVPTFSLTEVDGLRISDSWPVEDGRFDTKIQQRTL